LKDFNKVLVFDPNLPDAISGIADCEMKLGDIKKAIKDFDKVIEMEPKDGWAYLHRAFAKIQAKDYPGAIQDCNQASKLMPTDPIPLVRRGDVKVALGKYSDADADYVLAIGVDRSCAEAYYKRALEEIAGKHYDFGCRDLQRAKELGQKKVDELIKQNCEGK